MRSLEQRPATADERAAIAAALRSVDADRSALVAKEAASTVVVTTGPALGGVVVARADAIGTGPQAFWAGVADGRAAILTADPAAFDAVVAGRLVIDGPEAAVAVARVRLEATRTMTRFGAVVDGVDDIKVLRSLSPEQQAVLDRLRPTVTPPAAVAAVADGDGFVVTAYVHDGPTLSRWVTTLTASSVASATSEVVAEDLPVPFSR